MRGSMDGIGPICPAHALKVERGRNWEKVRARRAGASARLSSGVQGGCGGARACSLCAELHECLFEVQP